MKHLGSENTILQQTITFVGTLFIGCIVFLFFLYRISWDSFFFLIFIGLLFWFVNYLNLKFYEVRFDNEKIQLKNLFATLDYSKSEFDKVDKTFASPYFFQILIKKRSFYFFPKANSTLIGLMDTDSVLLELNKIIKN